MNRLRPAVLSCLVVAAPALHAAGTGSTLHLINGWTGGPQLTAVPSIMVEDDIVRFSGGMKTTGTNMSPFRLPLNARPETNVYVTVELCDGDKGRLYIQPDGTVLVNYQNQMADAQCFVSLDGAQFVRKADGATPLVLENGWTTQPFATSAAAARTVDGIVYLKGAIANGTATQAFTLPPQFRPNGEVYLPIDICNAWKGRLRIEPTGAAFVTPDEDTGGNTSCFTSLDGVSYPLKSKGWALPTQNGWAAMQDGTRPLYVQLTGDTAHFSGAIATTGTNLQVSNNAGYWPMNDVYVGVDLCHGGKGRVWIDTSGVIRIQPDNGATGIADAQCMTSLEGISYRMSGQTPLVLQNGWTGGPFATSQPSIMWSHKPGDQPNVGVVNLRGAVASGTTTLIANVPKRYRPNHDLVVEADLCGAQKGRLHVATTGDVTVEGSFSAAQCFVSLDGVTWTTNTARSVVFTTENAWVSNAVNFPNSVIGKPTVGTVHLQYENSGGSAPGLTPYFQDTVHGTFFPEGGDTLSPVMLCNLKQGRIRVHPLDAETAELSVEGEDGDFADAQCGFSLEGAQYATRDLPHLDLKHHWRGGPDSTRLPGADNIDGVVYFSGAMWHGTGVAFRLPPALRPENDVYVPVTLCNAHKGRLHIEPTGQVTVDTESGDATEPTCFTGLDGASFVP